MELLLRAPQQLIKGSIILEGSKSISNRLLIMQKLCPEGFDIENLSPSDDTKTCLLYTSPSPRDRTRSRMPSSA